MNQLNEYKTFKILNKKEKVSENYKQIPYHIVFSVKFDLKRTAKLVAGSNKSDLLKKDCYSGMVSLDTIKMGFFL